MVILKWGLRRSMTSLRLYLCFLRVSA